MVLLNETHIVYYNYCKWEVIDNDQVFQQAIATARHNEVRRRRLLGHNKNIFFELLWTQLHNPRLADLILWRYSLG